MYEKFNFSGFVVKAAKSHFARFCSLLQIFLAAEKAQWFIPIGPWFLYFCCVIWYRYYTRKKIIDITTNKNKPICAGSVRVAEPLALPTSDHGVADSNPAGGEILPEPKWRFIAQRQFTLPSSRKTEILLKGRKTITHPSSNMCGEDWFCQSGVYYPHQNTWTK